VLLETGDGMSKSVRRALKALYAAILITAVVPIAGSAAPRNEVTFRDAAGDATGGAADILSASGWELTITSIFFLTQMKTD
jgi:hypothetical protein